MLRRGVDMRSFDHVRIQLSCANYGRIKVLDLEPQHDAVPNGRRGGIDEIGVMFLVPGWRVC